MLPSDSDFGSPTQLGPPSDSRFEQAVPLHQSSLPQRATRIDLPSDSRFEQAAPLPPSSLRQPIVPGPPLSIRTESSRGGESGRARQQQQRLNFAANINGYVNVLLIFIVVLFSLSFIAVAQAKGLPYDNLWRDILLLCLGRVIILAKIKEKFNLNPESSEPARKTSIV